MAFGEEIVSEPVDLLPEDSDIPVVVWWYSAIEKNLSARSTEPLVDIHFREIRDDGFGKLYRRTVGITHLGQFPIGTIWQGRTRVGEIDLAEVDFIVDFSESGWDYVNAWAPRTGEVQKAFAAGEKKARPKRVVPERVYKLGHREMQGDSQLVRFKFTDEPDGLVIPTLEFFSRMYGRSQYIKRVLASVPFDQACAQLFVPDVVAAPEGTWPITVNMRCTNEDALFLAHVRHDRYTQMRVREVWAQMEGAQMTGGKRPVFPRIGPWFAGSARLRLRGKWLDSDQTRFLGLQILGCSEPGGAEIYLDRQNTNLTGPVKQLEGRKRLAWPNKVRNGPAPGGPSVFYLTHEEDPATDTETTDLEDTPFIVLGERRAVTKMVRPTKRDRQPTKPVPKKIPERVSGGESRSTTNDTGEAKIVAPELYEGDFLSEVWAAMKRLEKKKYNGIISAKCVDRSLQRSDQACPLSFKASSDTKTDWYLFTTNPRQYRGALLVEVTTVLGVGFIFEIQRKPRKPGSTDSDGCLGLAFSASDNAELKEWLDFLLKETVIADGVYDNIEKTRWPGSKKTFKHRGSEPGVEEDLAKVRARVDEDHERWILNGLAKLGIA